MHVIKNVDLQRSSTLKATFKGEPDPDYRVAKSVKGECCTYDPYLLESNKFTGKDSSGNPIQFNLLISSRELEFITPIAAEEFIKILPQAQDSVLARLVPTTKNEICAVYVGRNRDTSTTAVPSSSFHLPITS